MPAPLALATSGSNEALEGDKQMNRNLMMAALAVCLIWPAVSVTQEAPRARTRTRPRVRVEGPLGFSFNDNRGRIGVIVDTRADAAGDKVGARIEGITPSGPAEQAGLKAGDVITRFNGTALGGVRAEDDVDSGPGMKLIELARELEPGDTVQVEYRRGNDARKATIVAENLGGEWGEPGALRSQLEQLNELMPRMRVGPGNDFEFAFGRAWGGIELVKLNPDLGDYFGTREGVLVVSAPEDSTLALKGGDVITAIGGRKPTSPMQAMRILRSYDPGETVTLDVLRKQKRVTVGWKVPENDERHFRMLPRMREEPSWFRVAPKVRSQIEVPVWKIRDVIRTTRAI
ncbi:MAG TPA: PDZ domain-containing protein [Gemmatimonadales bacterium]|nr:PDZ domain-containing protein [Gemmatimonadales bacterium]